MPPGSSLGQSCCAAQSKLANIVSKEDYYNQGMEHFAQDQLDDAVSAYLSALDDDPNYADALHALAMTYAHQEKIDLAIDIGKRLIDAAPEDELAYTSLSIFYQQKGLIAEAEAIAAKARTLGWKRQLSESKTPGKN
jgi:tetratricopeptide (TPR) repeat protein